MAFSTRFKDMYRKKRIILEEMPRKRPRFLSITYVPYLGKPTAYNPLLKNFDNITKWLYLRDLNLSNNNIEKVPMYLGILPFLQRLNLSRNEIGSFYLHKWLCLRQAALRKNLSFLDISYNSLIKLPEYIIKLDALVELNISHNDIRILPHNIGKMKNLKILNLSHNSLTYLPIEILNLFLRTIDVSMNPFVGPDRIKTSERTVIGREEIPTLIQLTSRIVRKYRPERVPFLPYLLMEDEDITKYCGLCEEIIFKVPYVYALTTSGNLSDLAKNVTAKMSENLHQLVPFEYYYCYPVCKSDYN